MRLDPKVIYQYSTDNSNVIIYDEIKAKNIQHQCANSIQIKHKIPKYFAIIIINFVDLF